MNENRSQRGMTVALWIEKDAEYLTCISIPPSFQPPRHQAGHRDTVRPASPGEPAKQKHQTQPPGSVLYAEPGFERP